jgi:hypothetical protein
MAAEANDGSTLEQRLRLIGPVRDLQSDRQPSAERRYRRRRLHRLGVDRGRRVRPWRRVFPVGRTSGGRQRVANPEHYRAIEQGIAHFAGLPYVRISGDTAFAISYLQILVPDRVGPLFDVPNHGSSRGFHVHRVSANRWEFVRTDEGWKIKRRTLRPLDGTPPAREILGGALEP